MEPEQVMLRSSPLPATVTSALEFGVANKILLLKASAIKIELSALIVISYGELSDELPVMFSKIIIPTSNEIAKKRI